MNMLMGDSISTIHTIGAIHGVILSIALFFLRRGNPLSNRILASIILIFSFGIIIHVIFHQTFPSDVNIHSFIDRMCSILLGPLIYFYVKSKTDNFSFTLKKLSHFSPFSLWMFAFSVIFHDGATVYSFTVFNHFLLCFLLLHSFIYLYMSLKLLCKYNKKIKKNLSDIKKINLNWLTFLLISFSLIWFTVIVMELHIFKISLCHADYLNLLISIIIYSIGFIGFKKPEAIASDEPDVITADLQRKKYEKSTLTNDMADTYFNRLMRYTQEYKPFLSPEISLQTLAKQLAIPSHHLSQIINEKLNQNFFEYVNSFRVKEAKELIADPQNSHIKIAEIAFMTGFNSISTFNSAFKKNFKITPSQFKKELHHGSTC